MNNDEKKLIEIINSNEFILDLLKIVRDLKLPDCFIGAGAIRNLVWDFLHDYKKSTLLNDVDVIYCDCQNLSPAKDLEIWKKLSVIRPDVKWNVFNQARAHLKNPKRKAAKTTEEGMSYWPETPTCIGVRLNEDDSFSICAPYGIEDLMSLIVRPILEDKLNKELYSERIKEKDWKKNWPKLKIMEI